MRMCILASDEHVETIRQTAKNNGLVDMSLLTIPVSKTGELPATHWFCNFKVSETMRDKLLAMKNLSEMEETDNWQEFLNSRELKTCKKGK
jgi:carboxypeptidase C (cathepsin A)